jgi:predicted ATPase/class 3 adenylate cyclase
MDIGVWLQDLGLGQYEAVFRESKIGADVLPELTETDLKDLGLPLGDRKRLLKAIANLGTTENLPLGAPKPAPAPPHPTDSAERRQVTVMFTDLVGSTALSTRIDPEDLREIIGAYHKCVAETVARFDGFVAKYMGDGVLIYFGYPQAHEDDAERAVRAGLALVDAVASLGAPEPLQMRVGIATGLVVVGDIVGSGEAQERGIVGETPNLAARLQGIAEPNTVVIADNTRRLLGNLFELQDLGTKDLKGIAGKVAAWAALRASSVESRFEALHAGGLTALVGREEELELLLRRWTRAKTGEGQVALISGEPGIGKSRITQTIAERISSDPHIRLRYYCSPHHQDSALYPSIAQLERAAGFRRDDNADQRLNKLEAVLAQGTNDLSEAIPLLAGLLSIPTGDRYPTVDLTPQKRKEKTLDAQLAQVEGLASRQPVLMVWEDVHWSDPTTRESLDLLIDRVATLRVLVIITFRPEFAPPWIGRPHVTTLTLNRLPLRQRIEMISHLTGGKALPKEIADQIVDRTDGVPLFVEELTKSVVESGLLKEAGGCYAVSGPITPLAIPTTLHASLLARLDRLAPTREVAQIAAALGRQFSYELISAVAAMPQEQLDDALTQLTRAELLFRRGSPPDAEYTFKHALVQDAAYSTLLYSRRHQLHGRIRMTLESQFPEIVETQPEVLAWHCAEAGLNEQATYYWQLAGQRALERSAMTEAVAHLTKGLNLLESLPGGPKRQRQELGLQLALGQVSIAAKGFAADETGRAYARARELCLELGGVAEIFPVLYGRSVFHFERGELAAARGVGAELLRLGEERREAAAQVTGHRLVAAALCQLGKFPESRAAFEAALALYNPVRDRTSAFVYAIDSRVMCTSWLSHLYLILGHAEQALARDGQLPLYVRELAHPNTAAVALTWGCIFRQLLDDRENAREQAQAAIVLATERGFPLYRAAGTVVHGWALAEGVRLEDAIAEMRRGLADYSATGADRWSSYFLYLLADAYRRAGQAAEGLNVVADALGRADQMGAHWIEAELHRVRGELLLIHPAEQPEAETCFQRALVVAQEQGAKFWELRAATSLARLWRDQGKRNEACDLLAPVYGWFTEGFDTLDLRQAKGLLEELAAS